MLDSNVVVSQLLVPRCAFNHRFSNFLQNIKGQLGVSKIMVHLLLSPYDIDGTRDNYICTIAISIGVTVSSAQDIVCVDIIIVSQ